jgi:hypothetical protein
VLGSVLVVSVLAAFAVSGALLTATLRLASPAANALGCYIIAWSLLVSMVALLSLASRLERSSLVVGAGVVVGVAFATWWLRGRPGLGSSTPVASVAAAALRVPVMAILAATLCAGLAYVIALAFGTAPNDWDGLTYHLGRAALWLQQDAIGYVPAGNDTRLNGNPPLAEVGVAGAIELGSSDRFAALPAFVALLAGGVAVSGLGRRLAQTHAEAVFSGLVFVSLPVVLLHGGSILNDLVAGTFLLTAAYFLLGSSDREAGLGALSLGLALATKFSAVLSLPVVALVLAAGAAPSRRLRTALFAALGLLVGAPWYVVNRVETGHFDGGLGGDQQQLADHSLGSIVSTTRALIVDYVDLSGASGGNVYAFTVVGAAIGAAGILSLRGGGRAPLELVLAGAIVAILPLLVPAGMARVESVYRTVWEAFGHADIGRALPESWGPQTRADTSRSAYGLLGAAITLGGLAVAWTLYRDCRRLALAFAAAPLVMPLVLAALIVWDPWRSRLLMFPVGLACATWGRTLRIRWLAYTTAGIAATTVVLALLSSTTKPSGLGDFQPPGGSIWGRDRVDMQTAVRYYEGTSGLLRAVERVVPPDALLAAAVPRDAFLAPLFGVSYERRLTLVRDGAPIPPAADWLVLNRTAAPVIDIRGWRVVYDDRHDGWRVLQRRA